VQCFTDTVNWLLAEEFVRGTGNSAGAFNAVSLTIRGSSVLNQVPRSIATKPEPAAPKTLGTLMREAAVSQGAGTVATLIQTMLGSSGHR
jgi:hypothetical protein